MKEFITDNNESLEDGSPNPMFGTTTVIDHPDPPIEPAPVQPTKAQLLARVQELVTAVNALKE